jgi:hypothetical protein
MFFLTAGHLYFRLWGLTDRSHGVKNYEKNAKPWGKKWETPRVLMPKPDIPHSALYRVITVSCFLKSLFVTNRLLFKLFYIFGY